ncbi:MAG: glycosyltransferase family 4 protein [Anaerolinea sp.]|nr:glycosyltransferase family 4 protein [Anaerolinea sp.]
MSKTPRPKPDTTPLRILMIAPTSFFSDYGGHIRILEETRHLQQAGHQVAIVTYYKGDNMPGLDIRRTAPLPWHTDYEVGSSRHKIAFDVYLTVQALIEAQRLQPHIIHGHMHEGALIGGLVSRLRRTPLVFDFQGSLTGEMVDHHFLNPDGPIYPWAYRLESLICRLPHAFLTSSLRAARLLEDEFHIPAQRLHPLPDCADTARFDPLRFTADDKWQLRQRLGIPADRLIIAYLGLLTDYQGIPHLIDAAANLLAAGENVHFLIMGYPDVARYTQMAQQKGVADHMTFTGKVEYRDAPYFLSLGDIAVAPKVSATEGSGKVLNYMAMAQPIVAYDTAVHREYLADLGVYAAAGDVAAFTAAIQQLLHDAPRRAQLGLALRQRAATVYSWQRATEHIIDVYRRLLT